MRLLLDFIYPSFCIFCKNKADANDVFCSFCTKHLVLEMDDNIMHVLEENPISLSYLKFIRKNLPKKHIQILAAFTVVKYFRVFKNTPQYISASNNKLAHMVGKRVAKILKVPFRKSIGLSSKKDLKKDEKVLFFLQNVDIKDLTIV